MAELELPIVKLDAAVGAVAAERPLLINRDPGPGEIGARRGGGLCFELIDPEALGISSGSTNVSIEGVTAINSGVVQPGFSATTTAIADGFRYCITPDVDWLSEQEINVSVHGKTSDGEIGDWSYSFTVEDFTAPVLVAAQARDRTLVRLSFSEAIEIPEGASFLIEPQTAPAVGVVVTSSSSSGATIDLVLDRALSPGESYKAIVTGVEDLRGNPVAPGSVAFFVGFEHDAPEGRSFSLWEMLPRYNRRADLSGDLFLLVGEVWQELVDLLLCEIDRFREIYDIERASERFLDLILHGLGNPFDTRSLSVTKKRRLAASLVQIYQSKGTAKGLIDAVRFFLEIEIEIRPLGRSGSRLGISRLDLDLVLGSSDLRVLYSFVVVVPRELTEDERAELEAIVLYMKPAREHFAGIREPAPPPEGPWELGNDLIGTGSILS